MSSVLTLTIYSVCIYHTEYGFWYQDKGCIMLPTQYTNFWNSDKHSQKINKIHNGFTKSCVKYNVKARAKSYIKYMYESYMLYSIFYIHTTNLEKM